MKTVFGSKVDIAKGEEFTIGKVIELSQTEYEHFSMNLLDEYAFIEEYADKMDRDENGVRNCLLVLCEGEDNGILVNSQGEANTRYSAPLPYARQIAGFQKFDTLKTVVDSMLQTAEYFAKQAVDLQKNREYEIGYDTIEEYSGIRPIDATLLIDMLCECEEVEDVSNCTDGITITVTEESLQGDKNLRRLTQAEVDIMCAKHILWFNGAGGEQADFSGCLLEDIKLPTNLPNAIYNDAMFVGVSFKDSTICYSLFNNAKFYDCDFTGVDSVGSGYRRARFYNCTLDRGNFENSNFAWSSFVGGTALSANFENCCIEGWYRDEVDNYGENANGVSHNEKRWLRENGITMKEQQ